MNEPPQTRPARYRARDGAAARRGAPVVIAGSGVWWSRPRSATCSRFIEHTSLPLYTITMARGAVPDDHPLMHGLCRPGAEQGRPHGVPRGRPVPGARQADRLPAGAGRRAPVSAGRQVHPDRYPRAGTGDEPQAGCSRSAPTPGRALRALRAAAGGRKPWTPLPWLDRLRELRARMGGQPGALAARPRARRCIRRHSSAS